MCEEEPEAKNGLGKDVKNGISQDLSINRPLAGTISNTPDNWVQGPEDEGEATEGCKELSSGIVLGSDGAATRDGKDVDDDEIGNAAHSIVSPLLSVAGTVSSKETSEDHDQVSNDSDEEIRSIDASKETEIKEKERGGQGPIDVSGPEDLTVDVLDSVGNVLVDFLDQGKGEGVSITSCHGEV